GLVSAAVNLHYGGGGCLVFNQQTQTCVTKQPNDPAIELEYAPFGVDSGLCLGTATTAIHGEGVSLQPCGLSSKTVWIADVGGTKFAGADDINALRDGYIP